MWSCQDKRKKYYDRFQQNYNIKSQRILMFPSKDVPHPSAQVSDTQTLFPASGDHRLSVKAAREKKN